ncbi:hypothetical protein TRFO_32191 [Tritrichomonas foetus]|uniref:Adenylate and Guanylate cyclase catalytic domain containing protein n=1 Tax=Tritrichomonas foetus TaxID=1144522 RepID=A0A1J4JPI6_9EUKA|nr:hypothetical protein TRFO_32191 [Tritrichomonas foetus]|eukprot:OHT00939.1 hypothetical protein TRFO_32191 [Tritrichomonas foetus]
MSTITTTFASSLRASSHPSQGASVLSVDEENTVQHWQDSFIFPLFSEITRIALIPPIFYGLLGIIQFLQTVTALMYIGNDAIWRDKLPEDLKFLSYFNNFGISYFDDFESSWPLYVIIIGFFAIEMVFTIFILLWYRKKRSFIKFTLYVANFLYGIFTPIFLIPACGLAGYAGWEISKSSSISSIGYFLISFLPALVFIYIIHLNSHFSSTAVFISRSIIATWDGKIIVSISGFIGLASFLSPILNAFPGWLCLVGILISVCGISYQLYLLHYLPFINFYINAGFQALLCYGIFFLFMTVAHYFVDLNINIMFLVPFGVLLIALVTFSIINIKRKDKILSKLSNDNFDTLIDENEKRAYLDTQNFGNDNNALLYMRFGIVYMKRMCVDFTFMKYLIDTRPNKKIIFSIIQMAAMFPAQNQLLSKIITIITKSNMTYNLFEKFLIYQVKKVHVIRQSSVSKEAQTESIILTKMSEETISLVRGFWGEISHTKSTISTASLRYFRNATTRTNSAFLDALEQYPKSQIINDQYIRFLIEAMGDYNNAVKYSKRLLHIEQGRKMINDHAYKAFVNKFPKFLTEKILDAHGFYLADQQIDKSDSIIITNNESTHFSETHHISNEDMQYDEITNQVFSHGKLRLALQNTLDKSKISSYKTARFFSIFNVIVMIIISIIIIIALPITTDESMDLMKSNSLTSKIASSLQYGALIAATRLLEFTAGTTDLSYLLCYQLSIQRDDLPNFPSVFNTPYVALSEVLLKLQESIEEEMALIFSRPSVHKGELSLYNDWLSRRYTLAFDSTGAALSFRGSLNLFASQIERLSSLNSPASIAPYLMEFIQVVNNGWVLSLGFTELFYNVSQSGIIDCENSTKIIYIVVYIVSILYLIVFFILRLINYIIVLKDTKTLSDLLKSIPAKDIERSQHPIYKKNRRKLPTGTIHSAHDFSIEIYLLPLIMLLSIGVSVFIVLYVGITYANSFDLIKKTFQWSYVGSQRFSQILCLLLAVCIEHSNIKVYTGSTTNETIGENLERNAQTLFSYQRQLDLAIIGNDDEFDNFYYHDQCSYSPEKYNFAKYLDCVSLSNKMNIAINYYNLMNQDYGGVNMIFYTQEFSGLAFICDKYVYNELRGFNEYLEVFSQRLYDNMNDMAVSVCCIGKNQKLLEFFSNKKELTDDDGDSEAETVIQSLSSAIININKNLIVQTVNPIFTKMIGFSSDHILGQSIIWLIPLPINDYGRAVYDKSPFYQKIDDIKYGGNINMATINIKIRNSTEALMPVRATIIKNIDECNEFDGMTLILKDLSNITQLKNKLQIEREKTSKLMEVLVPKSVFRSIKGKKQPVLFKVENATILFIEIVGLEDCVSSMTPKDLIKSMEKIYNCFDRAIQKYSSISFMRNESELIFAVSGLFDNTDDFALQARDVTGFMIEVVHYLEELNILMNTDFHLRTGAHLGGPISGYISDPDSPYFEIISDTMLYTNYIQEMGGVDLALVTETLKKYLDPNEFVFENKFDISLQNNEEPENVYAVKFKNGIPQEQVVSNNETLAVPEKSETELEEEELN